MPEADEFFHTLRGAAALVTCLVQTLNETDPSFQQRFIVRLERAYLAFRDKSGDFTEGENLRELTLLSGTREMLTGFSVNRGQGKPFLR